MSKKSKKRERVESPAKTEAKKKQQGKGTWKMLDRGATVAGILVARESTQLVWRAATGKKPPKSTRHPELDAREAITWVVVGGVGSELVKLFIKRRAAAYWVKSTGNLPPGMKPLKDPEDAGGHIDVVEAAALDEAHGPGTAEKHKKRWQKR